MSLPFGQSREQGYGAIDLWIDEYKNNLPIIEDSGFEYFN
jgi:hypothetical protein